MVHIVSMGNTCELERQRRAAASKPETFRAVAERFLEQHVRRNRLRSAAEIERIFNRDLYPKWGHREFVTIRRGDVARLLDEIEQGAPVGPTAMRLTRQADAACPSILATSRLPHQPSHFSAS